MKLGNFIKIAKPHGIIAYRPVPLLKITISTVQVKIPRNAEIEPLP